MTCNKSSVNHTARYDLLRCFRQNFIFPLVMTVIMLFTLYYQIASVNAYSMHENSEILYEIFDIAYGEIPFFFQYFYAAAGVLTAVYALSFLCSVKKCNVYLSAGIERKQLLKNRMISSLFYIFLAAFLPMVFAVFLNSIYYSVGSQLIKAALYYALTYFYDMLLGFAIGCAYMVTVGNIFEGIAFSFLTCLTPTAVFLSAGAILENMVNGSAVSSYAIFSFYVNISEKLSLFNPLEYLYTRTELCSAYVGNIPEKITGTDYLVVVCWLALASVILLFVPKLLEKRKAECAGAFGVNRIAVAFSGAVLSLCAFAFLGLLLDLRSFISYALFVLIPTAVYAIVVILIYRNKKDIRKNIIGSAVTAAFSLVLLVACLTSVFGFYTKAPDAEKVEKIFISPAGLELFIGDNYGTQRTERYNDGLYGEFTDPEDIKAIISIHEKVTKDLGKGNNTVCIAYKMKNGKYVSRYYENVSDEGARASLDVVNTKWYKNLVVSSLTNKDHDYEKELDNYNKNTAETRFERAEEQQFRDMLWIHNYFNNFYDMAVMNSSLTDGTPLKGIMTDGEITEFRSIFANELASLTAEQVFYPTEKPIYHVQFYSGKFKVGISEDYVVSIPIYSAMVKTLEFIGRYNISLKELTADDIESVAIRYNSGTFVENSFSAIDKVAAASYDSHVAGKDYENYWYEDYFIYDTSFENAEILTDREIIERYFDAFKTFHSYIGDKGEFVQFNLKDGTNLIAYVAEKDL